MLPRTLPAGFIAPCFPSKTDKLPSGSQWLHEIKHDGFRIIARTGRGWGLHTNLSVVHLERLAFFFAPPSNTARQAGLR
jgi:hypothetical protein